MRHEILRLLLLACLVSALVRASAPAPGPRRARRRPTLGDRGGSTDGAADRPPAGGPGPGDATGRPTDLREAPLAAADTAVRRRRRGRHRGRRGGANWARHGRIDRRALMIGHLNIQSIKPKLPELRTDLNDVYGFHVLGLAETWLTPAVPTRLLNVPGYRLYRADRPRDSRLASGHGGVAILAHESVCTTVLPRPTTETQRSSNLEIIWALMRFGKERQFLFASAYRHPTNTVQQVTADMDDLNDQLNVMLASHPGKTVILSGDLNACLLKTDAGTPGARLREVLAINGMSPVNTRIPTYRPAGSLIDIVAVSQPEYVIRSGVTHCHYGGPHDITRMMIRQGHDSRAGSVATVDKRCIGRIDVDQFNSDLYRTDWNEVWTCVTTTDSWDAFCRLFLSALDTVAPVRRVRVAPPGAPPLTAATRDLLASRRRALTDTSAAGRERYKELNRRCRAAIRSDTAAHLRGECRRAGPARMWRVLRPIIGDSKGAREPVQVTPEALNSYFSQIGQTTAAAVPMPAQPVPVRLSRVHTCSFKVNTVDIDTLRAIVFNMKPSTSTGIQGISVQMLQTFFNGIGHVLLNIVNSSIMKSEVPSSWKHAMITPLPKCTNATAPSDHRPLSILPAIMKIVERVVQQQLATYFNDNHLFTDSQHGYRTSHSTETALSVVTERIYKSMDLGHVCIVVMLDLSKCFDVVDHQRLLRKLALYGVNTDWFAAYLAGHTQQVGVSCGDGGPILSGTRPNPIGVYQGGSLSCLLYSIYALDMCLHVDEQIVQFADDTQLIISGPKNHLPRMIEAIESTLSHLFDWFCENRLKINAKKTQLIMFGTRAMLRNLPSICIKFNGTTINETRVVKNLGVFMDRHMTFTNHVDHVVAKCSGALIALVHARHCLPKHSLKPIVNALVISSLRYCISVYGTCSKTERHRIQKIINFAARVISGLKKHDHVSEVIHKLNWMTADQLVSYHRTSLVHKTLSSGFPTVLHACMTASDHRHGHSTRQSGTLRVPPIRTETGRRQLAYSGVQTFNAVSQARGCSGETFKTALLKWLRSQPS